MYLPISTIIQYKLLRLKTFLKRIPRTLFYFIFFKKNVYYIILFFICTMRLGKCNLNRPETILFSETSWFLGNKTYFHIIFLSTYRISKQVCIVGFLFHTLLPIIIVTLSIYRNTEFRRIPKVYNIILMV